MSSEELIVEFADCPAPEFPQGTEGPTVMITTPESEQNIPVPPLPKVAAETVKDLKPQDQNNTGSIFQWPENAVKDLVKIYQESQWMFQSTTCNFKQTWQQMADRLAERGWPGITGMQVSSKWRSLKLQYRKIRLTGGRIANSYRTWPYYLIMREALTSDQQDSEPEELGQRALPRRSSRPNRRTRVVVQDAPATRAPLPTAPGTSCDQSVQRGVSSGTDLDLQEMPSWIRPFCTQLREEREERLDTGRQLMEVLHKLSANV